MISTRLAERRELLGGHEEYRRASYVLLYQAIRKEGLLDFIERQPRTLNEVATELGCRLDRLATLEAVMNVLETLGVTQQQRGEDGRHRYSIKELEPELAQRPLDAELLRHAVGQERADAVVYAQAMPDALAYLRGEREGNRFGEGDLGRWQSLLEFPYWDYCRTVAAETVAEPGATALDLASGLGHGVRTLGRVVGPSGKAIGIEVSADFVRLSSQDLPPNCTIRQADLNQGLGFLEDGSANGAICMGAFHFVVDKAGFLRDLHRVLTPGGRFVIGNVVRQTDGFDKPAHEITTSMLQPTIHKETPAQFESAFAAGGFTLEDSYEGFGSVGWYQLVRR
jgi:SAM-dependent methyltransferase